MSTIELRQSVYEGLVARAVAKGLSLEAFLERLALPECADRLGLSGDELDRLLDAEASHNLSYQGTYSRADIYLEHD